VRSPSKLLPDIDYTIDGGKIILSESFLLRRGFCCNTKCRHCPYKGERPSATIVILDVPKALRAVALPRTSLPLAPTAPAPKAALTAPPAEETPETNQTG